MSRPKGYKCSAETIEKMKAARGGKPLSDEHKAALSIAHTGKIRSPEHAAKIAEANRGRVQTPEARAKMAAARKAYYAAKKARKPIYRVFNSEIGTFVQWFQYGETPGQIKAALTLFTAPKGHFEMLLVDGTAEDYARLTAEHENLRPLPPVQLTLV